MVFPASRASVSSSRVFTSNAAANKLAVQRMSVFERENEGLTVDQFLADQAVQRERVRARWGVDRGTVS